ncbi:MAG TPA: uracil-DNA glycosylase, partial [Hyphomicrobiaceae bacterium]|nr:uracil-DNA glycosylase [Hyphomicrobiaceae bacterium]
APSPAARAPASAPEPTRHRPAVPSTPAVRPQAATPSAAAAEAATLARQARSLPELEKAIAAFDGCGLKRTASRVCFFRGAETARVMIVGEAPGREEDLAGKPFVGPAGQLLDKMLRAAGIEPDTTHITNMVYWRPPGNRTPTPEEVDVCLPFLTRQIEFVGPEFVLVLGAAAAKGLLGIEEGITRARGVWRELSMAGRTMRAMATLHPAYLLRTPAAKRHAWRDVLVVKNALKAP